MEQVTAKLTDPITIGGVRAENRVFLAPLAGIGNWFVRLQAARYGAGLCFSEMISSFGIHYGNERTCSELLRVHPDEGPVAIQLFGHDPEVMASAAKQIADSGAKIVDINMGCPVPKVCKTGAGAALLQDPDRAVELAIAAREGSGLPVTVKLRPGRLPGDQKGVDLAFRLVEEAGISALTFHPRHASQQHKGRPDYDLARELVDELKVPVIISGGLSDAERCNWVFEYTGAAAIMLARGSFGNPWLFKEVLEGKECQPSNRELIDEIQWLLDCAVEHIGPERAARYLRKFYPWYVEKIAGGHALGESLQRSKSVEEASELFRAALDVELIA